MKMYDIRCPNCGRMNRDLLLDESDNWFECEECGMLARASSRDRGRGCVTERTFPERILAAKAARALKAI